MNDRLQTISGGDAGRVSAPDDEALDQLSRHVAEIHEHLARAHDARAAFERTGGRYDAEAGDASAAAWCRPGDPREGLGPPPRPDGFPVGLCDAYAARGRARLAREEYHLALADFAAALFIHPAASDRDLTGDLWDGRTEARDSLCGSFPRPTGEGDSLQAEAPAPAWMVRRIPAGHLVVGDDAILAHLPATCEGRQASVRLADRLAGDAAARSFFDDRYLVDFDEFDLLVYSFDGSRLRLVHLAPCVDDDPESSPIDS